MSLLTTIFREIGKTLAAGLGQLTNSSHARPVSKPDTRDIHFSNNFQEKARSWGLTEKDALDVYHHGQTVKTNMIVRKYNGYEIGIYYFVNGRTGQTVVTAIWKRERA